MTCSSFRRQPISGFQEANGDEIFLQGGRLHEVFFLPASALTVRIEAEDEVKAEVSELYGGPVRYSPCFMEGETEAQKRAGTLKGSLLLGKESVP